MSLLRLLVPLVLLPALAAAAGRDGVEVFRGAEADAEAARLHARADAFVRNVTEGDYSYAYIQFHWRRAGANLERIRTAYPDSATGRRLTAGELTVGGFEPGYFRTRVLPRLEEKKVGAFDAVNCAIFLYGLEGNRDAAGKKQLLEAIISTLCRQIRWSEALDFPVLDAERPWLWNVVVRQAAIYRNDKLTDELLTNIVPAARPMLLASVAEGLAFRGETAEDLEAFLREHAATAGLRLAALRGLVRREVPIERAVRAGRPLKGLYDGIDGVQRPEQRADLRAFAATVPERAAADELVATFFASVGEPATARSIGWSAAVHAAHLEHLVLQEQAAEAVRQAASLPAPLRLRVLTALAQHGATAEAETLRGQLTPAVGDDVALFHEFRGRMLATEPQLVVRERSFAELGLRDPNLTGHLICEWSLTPNRTLRGAAPWDAVVHKFAPGFENLPEPVDRRKIQASGG